MFEKNFKECGGCLLWQREVEKKALERAEVIIPKEKMQ